MPSRARRLRAEKAAEFRKQAGDFDPSKAGRSLDLRRTKEQKRSARPDRKPLKPAHNTTPGEGPRAPDGFPLVRLQRLMADAGVAARRVCESMIEQGKVEVNRKVVTRLRQVTAAIKQDGANQVSIITSTAERQAAIEFGKAAAVRPARRPRM